MNYKWRDNMDKINVFEKEYLYIKNEKYRDNLKIMVNLLPDYFFSIPASSTGKYHPSFSLGDAGLVRHTKAAVRIAYELLENEIIGGVFSNTQKDLMIFALLLHDGLKCGIEKEQYTRFDHPLLASKFIKDNQDKLTLSKEEIRFVCECIETHMGQWNVDYNGSEILPIPKNKFQKFVHMCDFLSSRKFLDIKFENDKIVG